MTDRNETISRLAASLKRYVRYQKQYIKLDLAEKLTLLLTALILGAVIFVIAVIATIFLGLTLAETMKALTGSGIIANGTVFLLFVALAATVYARKDSWIVHPLSEFFAGVLMADHDEEDSHE